MQNSFIDSLPQVRGHYRYNISLKNFSWFSVGGKAAVLFLPEDFEDLECFLQKLDKAIPFFVLGAGSNLLIRDGGFAGVIIKLPNSFDFFQEEEGGAWFGTSFLDQTISKIALQKAWGGFEFLSGIPGTLGGALAMNAGCYGSSISDLVIKVEALSRDASKKILYKKDFNFDYRQNSLKGLYIFTKALLETKAEKKEVIEAKRTKIQEDRFNSQPVKGYKTGGSTFKNPPGLSAWKLIEDAGCRGFSIGDAEFSNLHCNFLINKGSASAKDLEDLIKLVEKRVFDKSGIRLEREIIILGEEVC
jgi:UDP-N-acetylmuramate dehydrogenase